MDEKGKGLDVGSGMSEGGFSTRLGKDRIWWLLGGKVRRERSIMAPDFLDNFLNLGTLEEERG